MRAEERVNQRRAAIAILEENATALPWYQRYVVDTRIADLKDIIGVIGEPDELFNRRLDSAWAAFFRACEEHKKGREG